MMGVFCGQKLKAYGNKRSVAAGKTEIRCEMSQATTAPLPISVLQTGVNPSAGKDWIMLVSRQIPSL